MLSQNSRILNGRLPIVQRIAADCGKCDNDQIELCGRCPNRIDHERLILHLTPELRTVRDVARLALSCRESKSVTFLAEQLTRICYALTKLCPDRQPIQQEAWVREHPAVQWMSHLIKNRSCPNLDMSFVRLSRMVDDVADAE